MAIYIVSNRETFIKQNKEYFEDEAEKPIDSKFRVAKYNIEDESYHIFPDLKEEGYQGILQAPRPTLHGSRRLFAELYDECMKAGGGDILFFVHGFNYAFNECLEHLKTLNKLYVGHAKVKHIVYISWPSHGSKLKYKSDLNNAKKTGQMLAQLFNKLRSFYSDSFRAEEFKPCHRKLHMAAHSMGNEVLYQMMRSLEPRDLKPTFSEVILCNSDTRADAFAPENPFSRLKFIAERVHIYIHSSDDALMISDKVMGQSKRLGLSGPSDVRDLFGSAWVVNCSNLQEQGSLKEAAFDHWGYVKRGEVINDIREVLSGKDEFTIVNRILTKKNQTFVLKNNVSV